ncbi:MAG TPA: class I SAM-dependent methyltransferase [Anaerolineales bacterium]|nr:class I SAM-dependent methyltransferase [Anaerolineales bacterium]
MDRNEWLNQMRRASEEQYDVRWAPFYGEKWGLYDNSIHLQCLQEFLGLLPHNSHLLDAACGAGRYLPVLLAGGHTIIGIDQSRGMLSKAKSKFPYIQFQKVGLQEMDFNEAFDGIICMDAMENVPPEDWGLVLGNFHSHPSASQVREWVGLAGFELLKETDAGIWYYHILARKGQG